MVPSETDVLVVGAGIAGLVVAIETAEQGNDLDVTVVEKGTRAGGTSRQSGGAFYCFEDLEAYRDRDPPGNTQLQETVVRRHEAAWDWLVDHGVPLREVDIAHNDFENVLPEVVDYLHRKPVRRRVDTHAMIDALVEALEAAGGALFLETPMQELQVSDGAVTGAVVRDGGNRTGIDADVTVLATGGYAANERLVEQHHVAGHTDDLWLRASKWCTGDGLLAGKDVNAKFSKGMNDFYGKSMVTPPAEFSPFEYPAATAFYAPYCVGLNRHGERIADESASIHEKSVIKAATREGYSRLYYIMDDRFAESTIQVTREQTVKDLLEQQRALGGNITSADSLEGLGAELSTWDVAGDRAVRTIEAYNAAIRNGTAETELQPPRRHVKLPIETPPFHAIEVQPSITLTLGGFDVTEEMQVKSRPNTGSTFAHAGRDPDPDIVGTIDGLYAVGADVGNVGGIILMEEVSPMTVNAVLAQIAGEAIAADLR